MRNGRRMMVLSMGALALGLAATGCFLRNQRRGPEPAVIRLVVSNRSYFDVDVYVMRSASGPAYRLDTVAGNGEVELRVKTTDLGSAGELILQLHAIGSRYTWTSPSVAVDEGVVAHLEIYSDASGNLNRSNLYTVNAEAGGAP